MKPRKALPVQESKKSKQEMVLDCILVTTYGRDKTGKEFEMQYQACNEVAVDRGRSRKG